MLSITLSGNVPNGRVNVKDVKRDQNLHHPHHRAPLVRKRRSATKKEENIGRIEATVKSTLKIARDVHAQREVKEKSTKLKLFAIKCAIDLVEHPNNINSSLIKDKTSDAGKL